MLRRHLTLMLVALLLASAVPAVASGLSATDVLNRVRQVWEGDSFYAIISLDLTVQAQTESYRFEVWTQGEDKALLRFQAPKEKEGEAYLQVGNDLWYYSPKLGRAIKLPSMALGEAILGAGPSLDDLFRKTLAQDYQVTMSEKEGKYLLTLLPHEDAPVVYGMLKVLVRPDFSLEEVVYFDQRGEILRTARFASYLTVNHRIIPTLMTVEDSNGDRTVERLENVQFGISLPPDFFTIDNLESQ